MFLEKKCSLKGRTMLLVDLTRALLNLEKLYPFQKFIKIEHPLEIFFRFASKYKRNLLPGLL